MRKAQRWTARAATAGVWRAEMRIVVFGIGNEARGDDALGPLLLRRVEAAGWPGVTTVEDYQLQIEHALDLADADLALFIDAGTGTPAPYDWYEIAPAPHLAHTSHALAPETVLAVYERVHGRPPPRSFVLCVRGERFGLGESLSAAAAENMEAAWSWLLSLPGWDGAAPAARTP